MAEDCDAQGLQARDKRILTSPEAAGDWGHRAGASPGWMLPAAPVTDRRVTGSACSLFLALATASPPWPTLTDMLMNRS